MQNGTPLKSIGVDGSPDDCRCRGIMAPTHDGILRTRLLLAERDLLDMEGSRMSEELGMREIFGRKSRYLLPPRARMVW